MAITVKTFNEEGQNYYYLHRHMAHFEKDAAISLFEQQKKQGYLEAKNRYMKNYLSNIQAINKQGLKRLNDAMSEEEIINNLDEAFLEVLNNNISKNIQEYDLDTHLSTAYESLNKYLKTKDTKELDKIFTQITKATKLLNTDRTALTALIGQRGEYKKHKDLNKLYYSIKDTISTWEGKTLNVSQQRMLSIMNSLKGFVGAISANDTNKRSLQSYLSNIFSTQIGEYIVSKGTAKGLDYFIKEIRASLTGTKNIKYEEGSELANFIKNYGQKRKQVFKTDNSFKGISISLEDGSSFNINLGLSTKWYKNNGVSSGVAITSERSFIYRVEQMLNGEIERYYAYNGFGLVNEDDSVYRALKAALIARNIDVFISGLGTQGDFSQFIVINGEFYSVWQIINAIENYNEGQGSSGWGTGGNSDPVTISAGGLSRVAEMTDRVKNDKNNLVAAYARAKQQNKLINNLSLSGYFYPQRLKNLTM